MLQLKNLKIVRVAKNRFLCYTSLRKLSWEEKMDSMNNTDQSREIDYQQLETEANVFSLKCLVFAQLIHGFMWVLNVLNIFIVDAYLMNRSFFAGCVVVLIAVIVCVIAGMEKPWIKYFVMFALITDITIINVNLTYHTVLLFVLPLLYSIQYCNRKMVYCSYILSVVSIYISCMVGYFYGLCDANMAVITIHSLADYCDQLTGELDFGYVNDDPWSTLALFYVLPRSLILFLLIPITRNISDGIAKRAVREQSFKQLSEEDKMTSLYNRNKYIKMVQEYYPSVQKVGVIFWDVNGLKETNDTLGHEYGDYLITTISDSIREMAEEPKKAYRIGGDEFVMIIEGATEEMIADILKKWEHKIEKKNNMSKITLSASVGYAIGNGKEIEEVINQADANMYEEKKKYHLKD